METAWRLALKKYSITYELNSTFGILTTVLTTKDSELARRKTPSGLTMKYKSYNLHSVEESNNDSKYLYIVLEYIPIKWKALFSIDIIK